MDQSIDLNQLFLDEHYSIEALLQKTQTDPKISLASLRQKLLHHQQVLNQTSLELFNNSYDRFYKLSHIISCLAEPIQHLADPLDLFRGQLGDLCGQHSAYVEEIDKKLSSLEETSKNKELASRLIELIKRRDRIEQQMLNIDWSVRLVRGKNSRLPSGRDIDYTVKCDLLERVSIELYYLISELRAVQPTHDELIPIRKSLETNLEEQQCQLDICFEGAFLEAIELEDTNLIDLILRTYKQKNATSKLDVVWRNRIVKPYLSLILTESQLSQSQIAQTYNLLDQFLKRHLQLVKADFLVASFWCEVAHGLYSMDKIYSLNHLETFRNSYLATRAFLEKQNEYLTFKPTQNISELDVKKNIRKVMGKFNLKGYFNHRLSQIASSVESSLAIQPLTEIPPKGELNQKEISTQAQDNSEVLSQFRLKICMHIYALVTKCWSNELFIDSLELSFSQLACMILNRFANWLSKLRLSDFRITGPSLPENNRQTNFLAKQDAIMRLLIEDCGRLINVIEIFLTKTPTTDPALEAVRQELINESFKTLNEGLNNVQSLQRLIER